MSIYEIHYNDYVLAENYNIGKRVRVFKGRKYPIGSEYVIKKFWFYHPNPYRTVEYAIMETGERINVDNLKLCKAECVGNIREMWGYDGCNCPNCKTESKNLIWHGDGFDPGLDLYIGHYTCRVCGQDVLMRSL